MNCIIRILRCIVLLSFLFLVGCATYDSTATHEDKAIGMRQSSTGGFLSASFPGEKSDFDKLADLWLKRSKEKANSDFPIGSGDVVEISVLAIEELRTRTVRISGDGTLALPFIGKIEVAGFTEEELQQKLVERLKEYMYSPRVIVFVKEYRSRQVAVLGSVTRPGVYSISSGADTLLDVLSQAGGIAPGADPKIYLIPAEPAEKARGIQIASSLPQNILQQAPLILKR